MKSLSLFVTLLISLTLSFAVNGTVVTSWVDYNKVADDLAQVDGHELLQYRNAGFDHSADFGSDTYDWSIECTSPCSTASASAWELQTSGLSASEYRRSTTPSPGTTSYQYGGDTSAWELWLYSGKNLTATTHFDVSSNAVVFFMIGDYNDGPANYLVDGIQVETADLRFGSQLDGPQWKALIVSGLSHGQHTMAIEFASDTQDFEDQKHVALFGAAAINIAEPTTLALFLSVSIVLPLIRRSRSSRNQGRC
ncbi:MAG: hypothetical protein KUG72_00160 [Pseudomonadales bacterium]|nr:hypothetical protein [Pseudomonadales bacterium]